MIGAATLWNIDDTAATDIVWELVEGLGGGMDRGGGWCAVFGVSLAERERAALNLREIFDAASPKWITGQSFL